MCRRGVFGARPLKREMLQTPPLQGEQAKIPTDKSRDFYEWWCRGDWFRTNSLNTWVLLRISEERFG
jgi:hypothetical protein